MLMLEIICRLAQPAARIDRIWSKIRFGKLSEIFELRFVERTLIGRFEQCLRVHDLESETQTFSWSA